MDKKYIKKLKEIVGEAHLLTSREECLCYSYDGTGLEYPPAAVAFPANTAEVSEIMQLAHATPFPVVVRGSGSGMTGGALPVAGGLVMATSRMNRILEIDTENQVAVVEPGVITGALQAEVERLGLYYPPDPASRKFCTMGGNVAECAGGPSAVKYGVTRDYVLGLTVVLADGRVLNTGVRTAKGVVGYDLTRLFIGSEGTLGVVTRITVRLLPHPAARATFLAECATMQQAARLVSHILHHLTPCTLEYLDRTAIALVADRLPIRLAAGTKALLLLEFDGDQETVARQGQLLTGLLADAQGVLALHQAGSEAAAADLWAARRSVSPASFDLRPHKLSEDVVVPRNRIPELVACTEELAAQFALPIFTFGHAGDGNIHVNIMLDKSEPGELERANRAKERLFATVLALKGTLSGEHGVGLTKSAYIGRELDPVTLSVMRSVKELFDPRGILNPGKIFPPTASGTKNH